MIFEVTPSQTVGPYFAIGLPFEGGHLIVPEDSPGAIRISGTIYDGRGDIVPDHLIEFWQPDAEGRFADIYGYGEQSTLEGFRGFGRWGVEDGDGIYQMVTVKPGPVPTPNGTPQAPHIDVTAVRPRDAEPRGHADLLRRRGRRQRRSTRCSRRCPPPVATPCWRSRPTTATASTSTFRAPERPSSLTSDLFAGTYARGGAARAVSAEAWVRAMVDAEAALGCGLRGGGPDLATGGGGDPCCALQQGPLERGRDRRRRLASTPRR